MSENMPSALIQLDRVVVENTTLRAQLAELKLACDGLELLRAEAVDNMHGVEEQLVEATARAEKAERELGEILLLRSEIIEAVGAREPGMALAELVRDLTAKLDEMKAVLVYCRDTLDWEKKFRGNEWTLALKAIRVLLGEPAPEVGSSINNVLKIAERAESEAMSDFVKCGHCGQSYPPDYEEAHRALNGDWCPYPSQPRGVGAAGDENLTFPEVWRMWQQSAKDAAEKAEQERDGLREMLNTNERHWIEQRDRAEQGEREAEAREVVLRSFLGSLATGCTCADGSPKCQHCRIVQVIECEMSPAAEALVELEREVRRFINRSAEVTEDHPAYGFVVMGIPLAKVIAKIDTILGRK